MWRIVHRLCVFLTVIVFCCGQYDCLQINEVVKSESEQRNIEEPKVAELSKNDENIYDNIPISLTSIKYANAKDNEYEVNLKDIQYENRYDETIRPIQKRRISRQATLANGYAPLYPQVPSAPPYGYQPASQQPQWNAQGYNNSQQGYPGYKPNNNMSPYNQNLYNSNHGPNNSSQGTYNTNHGPYNPNNGPYNTNQGSYNPNQNLYNPSQGSSNPNYRPYNQNQGPYNANHGIHNNNQTNGPYNSQNSHYPSHGQHNYSHNPYNPTQRPYNQAPYNPNNGPYNPAAGLNPYGGYPSQKPLNTSNQRYPSYNHNSLPHSTGNIPPQYPGYRPVNNSHSGQPSYNNNYPGNLPNSATQRSPYQPQNNPNSYQYPGGTAGGTSQYPRNTNPYGQNANAYPQYPNSNPQNPNPYPQNVNLSNPQYQPYPKQ